MKLIIVASSLDPAGMNIVHNLKQMQQFPTTIGSYEVDLHIVDESLLELQEIDVKTKADIVVFASKHVSKAGVHSLTLHTLGNFSGSMAGGRDREFVPAPAGLMKRCFEILNEKDTGAYEVVQEATHHGPYLKKPAFFIEIGSDEEKWNDPAAGKIIAETILEAIATEHAVESVIGIGGGHYCSNYSKVMKQVGVTFVAPKHVLADVDEELIEKMLNKSVPVAKSVVLDWKGLGPEKQRILAILEKLDVNVKRTKEF